MIYEILPVNNYCGNNSTKTFDFDFYIDKKDQLKVYLFDEYNIKNELILDIDYSINEIKNPNGSYITYPIESSSKNILGDKEKISIELSLPISQDTQYNNSSLLNLEALEYSLDYLTRLIQIISRKVSLCVKVDECSQVSPQDLIDDINSKTKFVINTAQSINSSYENIVNKHGEIVQINESILENYDKFSKIGELEQACSQLLSQVDNMVSKSNKTEIMSWFTPDVDNALTLAINGNEASFDVPCPGWICLSALANMLVSFKVNDVDIAKMASGNPTTYNMDVHAQILVCEGDVITYRTDVLEGDEFSLAVFIPCKGAVVQQEVN